jgi:hypothetical protein
MPGTPEPESWDPDAEEEGELEPELPEYDPGPATGERRPAKKRRLGAAMLAGAMVGLNEALFDKPKEEPVLVEANGAGNDDDDPLAVDLDPYDPSASIAVVRPWLQK